MKASKYITISSEQAWPQIIALRRFLPEEAFLFYSDDTARSEAPSVRLSEFIRNNLPGTHVHRVRFTAETFTEEMRKVIDSNTLVNLTGGTKLMGIDLFRESQANGAPTVYLEADRIIYPGILDGQNDFEPIDKTEVIDEVDPLELIKCQYNEEITDEGILLKLSAKAKAFSRGQISSMKPPELLALFESDRKLPDIEKNRGLTAEFLTAAAFLKMGALQYRLGVKLESKQEIDGLFAYEGHLYFIETKQRKAKANPLNVIRKSLDRANLNSFQRDSVRRALGQLAAMETTKKGAAYHEDQFFAQAIAGRNASVIWVTASAKEKDFKFAEESGIRLFTRDQILRNDFSMNDIH